LRWLFAGAALAALGLSAGCDAEPPAYYNRPPTVVITVAPDGVVTQESVRFQWQGSDTDGQVTGYRFGLDDSAPSAETESTGVWLSGLSFGAHDFYVRAKDDSGALSAAAVRSFSYEHASIVAPRGTDTTLEIASWNIENLPKSGQTLGYLRQLIPGLALDIYAVQEIADTNVFNLLLSFLPEYGGLYSADDYGRFYQKTGIIYRRSAVTVANVRQLFWSSQAFPRPPLLADVSATVGGRTFAFHLVVLHLKAGTSAADREKRRAACVELKNWLDGRLADADSYYVVAGDWNDLLNDAPDQNVFLPFLDDSLDYRFLTAPLAGNPNQVSYIGGGLIDHLLATSAALRRYAGGYTQTLRLDDEVPDYASYVSDHRPVMAVFPLAGRDVQCR
jgi:exonuclease III